MTESQPQPIPEVSFEMQVEKLLMNCSPDELKYLENALYAENEFRKFSETKIRLLKEKLKEMERDFHRKMKLKKELLDKQIEDLPCDESEESEEEEPVKKPKKAPSKKKGRKSN